MLHLIPAPLHRIAYRLAHGLRVGWWRLAKPRVTGCRILAIDPQQRVLLVRHSYGPRDWMLPSGGVAAPESPIAAAIRELCEETGCDLRDARQIAVLEESLHGTVNVVHLIAGETTDTPRVDRREITDAEFFAPDDLPRGVSSALRDQLAGWLKAAKAGRPPAPPAPSAPPPSPKA
jgi:8-oxo-dGTP pyrophosphatase MutT (NUDIX family)